VCFFWRSRAFALKSEFKFVDCRDSGYTFDGWTGPNIPGQCRSPLRIGEVITFVTALSSNEIQKTFRTTSSTVQSAFATVWGVPVNGWIFPKAEISSPTAPQDSSSITLKVSTGGEASRFTTAIIPSQILTDTNISQTPRSDVAPDSGGSNTKLGGSGLSQAQLIAIIVPSVVSVIGLLWAIAFGIFKYRRKRGRLAAERKSKRKRRG
jgi:hypothetical protein